MKRIVKIFFEGFWNNLVYDDNIFYNILSKYYDIVITDKNPDILFHSVFDNKFLRYNCLKILYSGENYRPNFDVMDYAITFDFLENENHLRFPIYYLLAYNKNLRYSTDEVLSQKSEFCSFVVSNPMSFKRIEFFKKLSKYKKVDSGGKVLNNIGRQITDKYEFLKKYKFNIAFENSSYPGYTTEKIYDAFSSSCIPIYWGNPLVGRDFDTNSFINYNNFKNENEIIDYIVYLDENDDKYLEMYSKYDANEFEMRKIKIYEELESFIIKATNQYLDFGITKSKYNNSSEFDKSLIKANFQIKSFIRYYRVAVEHRIKTYILKYKMK